MTPIQLKKANDLVHKIDKLTEQYEKLKVMNCSLNMLLDMRQTYINGSGVTMEGEHIIVEVPAEMKLDFLNRIQNYISAELDRYQKEFDSI